MKKEILVTVCMITYAHEDYIEQAINSILEQKTSFDYELLIANDCSPDKTDIIVNHILKTHPEAYKIRYVKHDKNIGMTPNFKYVLSQSKGKYTAICEGDDYWTDPLKLQKQVDYLEAHPEVVFSFTRFRSLGGDVFFKDLNERFFTSKEDLIFDFNMFTKGWYGGTLTLLFRTVALSMDKIKEYKYFRDIYLYTELLKVGTGRCLNFDSGVYRIHETGVHSSASKLERTLTAVKCYDELYSQNSSIPALKTKYYYYVNQYIKQLVATNHILRAISETLKFAFKMKDFGFLIKITKHMIKSNRVTAYFKTVFKKTKPKKRFESSEKYWEDRYVANKNSGAGSYGRLADFKADILNNFVKENQISSIIEYGCGDGNQLSLAQYPNYIGFDVSEKVLNICREKFKKDITKSFFSIFDDTKKHIKAELTLSLDVIYHLVEEDVFHTYMQRLFNASTHYVIIYSSNYDAFLASHVRCRKFTNWIEQYVSNDWELMDYIKNKFPFDTSNPNHTSMADFYIYKKLD